MMNKHICRYQAFSLVELMVVIAIVGILAAVAVPVYKTYQAKAKIGSVVNLLESAMKQIIVTYESTGSFPTTMLGGTQGAIVAYTGMPYVSQSFYGVYSGRPYVTVKFNDYPTTASNEGWITIGGRLSSNGVWVYQCGAWAAYPDAHAFGDSTKTDLLPPGCSNSSVFSFIVSP